MLFVACLLLRTRWPICRYLACLGLGFLWAVFNAGSLLGQMERLSHMPDVTAVAQVSSVALKPAASKQTLMRIERVDGHWLVPALAFTTTWVPRTAAAVRRAALAVETAFAAGARQAQ